MVSLWSLPCWLLWLPPSSCQDLSHMWQAWKKKESPQGGSKFLHRCVVNTVSSDCQPGSAGENRASCMANTTLITLWMILLDHILVRFSRNAAPLLTFFKSTDWLVIANSLDCNNNPPFTMLIGHELSCWCVFLQKEILNSRHQKQIWLPGGASDWIYTPKEHHCGGTSGYS